MTKIQVTPQRQKSNKRKIMIISTVVVLLVLMVTVVPYVIAVNIYNKYFGIRFETYEPLAYKVEDFPGLKNERYEFLSNDGQKIVGYNYYREDVGEPKAVIVMAHGYGNGTHRIFLSVIDVLTRNGYYVFAYDVTGNGESEGDSIKGLPQGVIDLGYAISFVEDYAVFADLPVALFGYSWGGHAVTNVLNYHPEVKAVVSLAGFNQTSDMLASQGELLYGGWVKLLLPYINLYEKIKFGGYATNTSLDGMAKTDAAIMLIYSKDDEVVQPKYGYDLYYEKYADSPRFEFIEYEDRGHSSLLFNDEAIAWTEQFNENMATYFEDNNIEATEENETKYIEENLDWDKWVHRLDDVLMERIVKFYNENI